ncbi:MAG TPA: hypothetical protein VF117_05815 [Gammaproteobacteria bacterium]
MLPAAGAWRWIRAIGPEAGTEWLADADSLKSWKQTPATTATPSISQ